MAKNIAIVIIVLIVGLTVVVSIYLWSSNNRYYMLTNKQGHVYGIDKRTGNTYLIHKNKKVLVKDITGAGHKQANIKSEATKDKAFLNSTWKMSPSDIERVNTTKLWDEHSRDLAIDINIERREELRLLDLDDERRLKIYESRITLWGAPFFTYYYFFDDKLYKYKLLVKYPYLTEKEIEQKNKETPGFIYLPEYSFKGKIGMLDIRDSVSKVQNQIISIYGKGKPCSKYEFCYTDSILWENEKITIYTEHDTESKLNLRRFVYIFFYRPFYSEIKNLSKLEKENYF